jgi:hypothetical protein
LKGAPGLAGKPELAGKLELAGKPKLAGALAPAGAPGPAVVERELGELGPLAGPASSFCKAARRSIQAVVPGARNS